MFFLHALGTVTTLEKNGGDVCKLVKEYAGDLPIGKTNEIGHGNDSKAIKIGERIVLSKLHALRSVEAMDWLYRL